MCDKCGSELHDGDLYNELGGLCLCNKCFEKYLIQNKNREIWR